MCPQENDHGVAPCPLCNQECEGVATQNDPERIRFKCWKCDITFDIKVSEMLGGKEDEEAWRKACKLER